jgi:hypothetical protein
VVLHFPLLRLPYFWDEAGYYVPAARDLLQSGTLIPHSTPSNAHPPLLLAYLALAWKCFGFTTVVSRTAMLAVAAFSLLGLFRLAQRIANTEVAVASILCTALYPVFFTQSSLVHLDLAVAGLTFWGLLAYLEDRRWAIAVWFSLAALTKETAVLAPLALFTWELIQAWTHAGLRRSAAHHSSGQRFTTRAAVSSGFADVAESPISFSSPIRLLLPLIPLAFWYGFHYIRTGFVFGNPEYFRYNVQATIRPLRAVLALGLRFWQIVGYLNLYILSLAGTLALALRPLQDDREERPRIRPKVQFCFLAVIGVYVVAMALVGGAVLARYMLPVVPLAIVLWVSTLRRRIRLWRIMIAIVGLAFAIALFVNPPHGFSIEDNLAYRDYVLLHQHAEEFLEARYPTSRVLTAWPASDELTHPYLGYVDRPMKVFRIEDFSVEQLMAASDLPSNFDVALVFSTKLEPPHPWFERWGSWQQWKREFFDYHRDVLPAVAAQILGGRVVYSHTRNGQWVAVIVPERVEEARMRRCCPE